MYPPPVRLPLASLVVAAPDASLAANNRASLDVVKRIEETKDLSKEDEEKLQLAKRMSREAMEDTRDLSQALSLSEREEEEAGHAGF